MKIRASLLATAMAAVPCIAQADGVTVGPATWSGTATLQAGSSTLSSGTITSPTPNTGLPPVFSVPKTWASPVPGVTQVDPGGSGFTTAVDGSFTMYGAPFLSAS